jgi:hypothetical protein
VNYEKKKREIERRAKKQARRRVAWNGSRAGRGDRSDRASMPALWELQYDGVFRPVFLWQMRSMVPQ